MRKINLVFGALLAFFVIACEGPSGPPGFDGAPGPQGPAGQDGVNILGTVIDIEATFTAEDDYRARYTFGNEVEVFPTDVVLVYLLWDQVEGSDGELIDIWRLLPQTRLLDQGILMYNYEHTFVDVDVFLEGDFDLATLLPGDTDNQIFRIAILPAESTSGKSSLDRSNVSEVMKYLGVSEQEVPMVRLK